MGIFGFEGSHVCVIGLCRHCSGLHDSFSCRAQLLENQRAFAVDRVDDPVLGLGKHHHRCDIESHLSQIGRKIPPALSISASRILDVRDGSDQAGKGRAVWRQGYVESVVGITHAGIASRLHDPVKHFESLNRIGKDLEQFTHEGKVKTVVIEREIPDATFTELNVAPSVRRFCSSRRASSAIECLVHEEERQDAVVAHLLTLLVPDGRLELVRTGPESLMARVSGGGRRRTDVVVAAAPRLPFLLVSALRAGLRVRTS